MVMKITMTTILCFVLFSIAFSKSLFVPPCNPLNSLGTFCEEDLLAEEADDAVLDGGAGVSTSRARDLLTDEERRV